jgi:hypothetical protein
MISGRKEDDDFVMINTCTFDNEETKDFTVPQKNGED